MLLYAVKHRGGVGCCQGAEDLAAEVALD
jgi:hypothetical protein